jgi:hypothetical protein
MALTTVDPLLLSTQAQYTGMKNRIINGAMVIDQRNGGASVTPATAVYTLDRWLTNLTQASKFSVQQNAGSVTPPNGFSNYLGATSLSAFSAASSDYFALLQNIEGFNTSDLGWGTANASPVTLSFWVRSSLTGTFGGSITNSAINRSYPYSYTVSSANTWEYKSVTIAGDTTGTWIGATNGIGMRIWFSLGAGSTYSGTAGSWSGSTLTSATGATSVVGTNGATFYITGVQLEKGTQATSFDYRPYGTELELCQRYYYRNTQLGNVLAESGFAPSSTAFRAVTKFPVPMRIAPTVLEQTGTAANYRVLGAGASSTACNSVPTFNTCTEYIGQTNFPVASGLTIYTAGAGAATAATTAYLGWSAEL